jgi:hypothetical protein
MSEAARLNALDALTVDAYNDEEQLAGFLVGADEALQGSERSPISASPATANWDGSSPHTAAGRAARRSA